MSPRHNPEFTILEFYQAYATYETLMEESESLVRHIDAEVVSKNPRFAENRTFSLSSPWKRVRMVDAVTSSIRKRFPTVQGVLNSESPPSVEELSAFGVACRSIPGISAENRAYILKSATAGELLFALFEVFAEPHLVEDYRTEDGTHSIPVFITDYPQEVSPLARQKDKKIQEAQYGADFPINLVDRFELFIDGRELANAFSELNNPDEQAERFRAQLHNREHGDEEAMDFDSDYIRALSYGMPPTAGFGMGVDRLVMLLTGQKAIRDVVLFPMMRPEST